MECSEFLHIVQNFQPQDIAQVERIAMICHLNDCPDCGKFIGEKLQENGIEDDPALKELAEMDRRIV